MGALRDVEEAERDYVRQNMHPRVSRPPVPVMAAQSAFAVEVLPWEAKAEPAGKGLSKRELEMLRLIRDGATNKQAAFAMGCTEQTAKNHMSSILAKLGAADRTHGVIRAVEFGLISLTPDASGPSISVRATVEALRDIEDRVGRLLGLLAAVRAEVGLAFEELVEEPPEPEPVVALSWVEPEPDVAPALAVPERTSGACSVPDCPEPVAPKKPGRGRPPLRCEQHIKRRAA